MRRLPLLLALALTAAPAAGAAPYLVKDINPTSAPASSEPRELVSLGSLALFETDQGSSVALWRSDGTVGGTYPLLEAGDTRLLALSPDRYFFLAYPPGGLPHLWVSDGSLPGTFQLTGALIYGYEGPFPSVWVPAQRTLYFAAAGDSLGMELWRTDGTPGGTYRVADIWPGPQGSNPRELTRLGGNVCFVANDPERGPALWRSDGTAKGTVPIRNVPARSLNAVGSRLVFVGMDSVHGSELWVTDGTAKGTRLLAELAKGKRSPVFRDFAVHGRRLYFVAAASAAKGPELWVTDGTAKGTLPLTNFAAAQPFNSDLPRSSPAGRLVFLADDGAHGRELWVTDGTARGTRLVRDICPGLCSGAASPLVVHQGKVYFAGTDVRGEEIWTTDGTKAGTRLVRDICPGGCGSSPYDLLSMGSRLLFVAEDGLHPAQIWATDGTSPGTVVLTASEQPVGSLEGAKAGDLLIFTFADSEYGREPWCTDGTPAGTYLLSDLAEGDSGGSHAGELMALGGAALFFADDGEHGYELWKSDGTAAGTALVTDLLSGELPSVRPDVGSWTATPTWLIFHFDQYNERSAQRASGRAIIPPPPPHPWTRTLWASNGEVTQRLTPDGVSSSGEISPAVVPLGSLVYFTAWDKEHGNELWVTDGTPAGTRLSVDLEPGGDSSGPHGFTVFQGKLWFFASWGAPDGTERLWRSDGTAAGTVAVGPALWWMSSPTVYKDRLWFAAFDDEHGTELWSTDGTDAGTVLTLEAVPGAKRFNTTLFTDGARLYFTIDDPPREELWVSDGTAAGTRRIFDRVFCPSTPKWAFSGGLLFYAASSGCELVVSDGTAAGTRFVHTAGGEQLDGVGALLPSGNRLLVATFDGGLWQTDGTDAGTRLIVQGREQVPELLRAGSRIFFPAWDAGAGWELWAIQE